MDHGARASQSDDMNATHAVRTTEGDLQRLFDSVVALCQPALTKAPMSSAADPAEQEPTVEPQVANGMSVDARARGALKDASSNRLACLFRHWTWATEAMKRFERELADGWDYDEDPLADHPFGAYYHWCALLCGFCEAALEHGLLSESQLARLRPDLEASLPGLRACRQLLVVIPAALEEHPRIVDLLHDEATRNRLRRIHSAFGDALREEQAFRELEWLLYEH